MARKYRNGLGFALEDDSIDSDLDVADTAPAAAAAMDEVNDDVDESEDLTAAIEEATDSADALQDITDTMEESVEEGEGVDPKAAEIAEIAVEFIAARAGVRHRSTFPAIESFGSSSSRVSATRVAVEGVKETIKKIWETIKAAIKRLWDKIKQFFLGITKNSKKLTEHLEALKKRVQDLPAGAKPIESKLDNSSLAEKLSIKGKADMSTAKKLLEHANKLPGATGKIVDEMNKNIQRTVEVAETIIKASNPDDETTKLAELKAEIHKGTVGAFSGLAVSTGDFEDAKADTKTKAAKGEKAEISGFGPFVGGMVIVSKYELVAQEGPAPTKGSAPVGISHKGKWSISFGEAKGKPAEKIVALNASEMMQLCNDAINVADEMVVFEKAQSRATEIVKKSDEVASTMMKFASEDSENSPKIGRASREFQRDINDYQNALSKLTMSFPGLMLKTVNACADYVSASLANCREK